MKMDLYQLFSAETKQSEREEAVENVRILTLRKIEQSETKRHTMRRPLRTVLLAAAALALLVSSVFAAPLLWNAITGIEAEQNARPVLYFDENTVIVEGGYIDIVPLPSGTLVLTEPAEADYRVYIFGAGHVSTALVPVLLPLGFPVTVIDQRPELAKEERFPGAKVLCAPLDPLPAELSLTERDYAVIMTPGHEQDLAVLRQVLKTPAFYIGCIGSRKKTAYVNQILREEGFSASDLERIHAPIGLPIMARTPEEIAVSIAAELILHRAGGNT